MSGRSSLLALCALGLAGLLSGCGSDQHDMTVIATAKWKEDPGRIEDIGYWVSVNLGWPDRAESCFDLPSALYVTVNGREGTMEHDRSGDCLPYLYFDVGPFLPDEPQPTIVRVFDGNKLLGEASYAGFFPGTPVRLVSPADGKVRIGDSVVISPLSPLTGKGTGSDYADYYWLESPDGLPPYHDFAKASIDFGQQSITIETPAQTGRAALILGSYRTKEAAWAESCAGFTRCAGWPSGTIGPVFVEVVP